MSLSYTLPESDDDPVADLVEHAVQSLPREFTGSRTLDDLETFGEMFAFAHRITEHFARLLYIGDSVNPWTALHARDRGIAPQEMELAPTLAARVRSVGDAVTPTALVSTADDVLEASGDDTGAELYEHLCDGAYYGYDGMSVAQADPFFWFYDCPTDVPVPFVVILADATGCGRFTLFLPAGTSDGAFNAITDQVRIIKAGGIRGDVERFV